MRMLLFHARKFSYKAREPALKRYKELLEEEKEKYGDRSLDEVLVVFTTIEDRDVEDLEGVVSRAVDEIGRVSESIGVKRVLVYPYAHLSKNLADPKSAVKTLDKLLEELIARGYTAWRSPFGWYKSFTLECYGHPLAELSREIKPEKIKVEKVEKREYAILTPEGDIVSIEDYDLDSAPQDFKVLVEKEVLKKTPEPQETRVGEYLKRFGFEWEPLSDRGHMRFGPEASIIVELVMEYSWNVARKLKIPIFYVKGTNMFDLSDPAVKSHAELFGDRLYTVDVGGSKYVLRFAACHQQFAMLRDWIISYKDLPFGMFEIADSYRLEQPGETVLGFRLRKFYMPDLHVLTRDLEEAKEISFKVHKIIYDEVRRLGRDYVAIYNITKSFLRENFEYVVELVREGGKPVLLNFYPEGKYYWVINVEYVIIDEAMRPREIGTFQIDVGNAKRFNIKYRDSDGTEKYPVIIHTALIGSVERYIYTLFDSAAQKVRRGGAPLLPTWISPVQVRVIPVSHEFLDYALKVSEYIESNGIRVDVDDRDETLSRKIRDAEKSWIPYVVVVGKREVEEGKVTVRVRRDRVQKIVSIEELIGEIKKEIEGYPWKPLSIPKLLSVRPNYRKF